MRALWYSLLALTLVGPLASPVHAEETTEPDPLGMWECPQDGDVPLYTNRERAGCRKMVLKPLSVVPALPEFPPRSQRTHPSIMEPTPLPQIDPVPPAQSRNVPDWGKRWYAANSSDASVQSEVCSLYSEWLQLNARTRGGFFFGNDPSYGSDPSRRNFWTSTPFEDNARYHTLANMFGSGFVPIGCL